METLLNIANSLSLNKSVLYQFLISVSYLIIVKIIFIDRLHEVLTARELKTFGLKDNAESDTHEAIEIYRVYKQELDQHYRNNLDRIAKIKENIVRRENNRLKEFEDECANLVKSEIEKYDLNAESQYKSIIVNELDDISKLVVNKLIQ